MCLISVLKDKDSTEMIYYQTVSSNKFGNHTVSITLSPVLYRAFTVAGYDRPDCGDLFILAQAKKLETNKSCKSL